MTSRVLLGLFLGAAIGLVLAWWDAAVAAIVAAVSPKPVNLLINAPFITVAEAAELGVRRISVGGTLARTAWAGLLGAAQEIADTGTFTRFERLPDVEALFQHR